MYQNIIIKNVRWRKLQDIKVLNKPKSKFDYQFEKEVIYPKSKKHIQNRIRRLNKHSGGPLLRVV